MPQKEVTMTYFDVAMNAGFDSYDEFHDTLFFRELSIGEIRSWNDQLCREVSQVAYELWESAFQKAEVFGFFQENFEAIDAELDRRHGITRRIVNFVTDELADYEIDD